MIFLSIGSNLNSLKGDRFFNIERTLKYLKIYRVKILKVSSYYETPAYPNNNDPKFINVVVLAKTIHKPKKLMEIILKIENKMGRKRTSKNKPRTCDIDILDFNSTIIKVKYRQNNLVIPHPRLKKRNFVLFPLKEISPSWKHPKTKEKIKILIKKLSKKKHNSILKIKRH